MKINTLAYLSLLLAICITTTMDFSGYLMYSAFPLIVITLTFWAIRWLPRSDLGLRWGHWKYYGWALLYPLTVLGATALIGYNSEGFTLAEDFGSKTWINILLGSTVGVIMVLLTEEGFFRGWLWGAFKKGEMSDRKTLWITSLGFVLWHFSAVFSNTDYGLPLHQIPVYLVNALLLALIWGLMRMASGSILVPSVSHAVWNALAYELFGFGEKVGALGVTNTAWIGPEVGYLGILLNGIFLLWLWRRVAREHRF